MAASICSGQPGDLKPLLEEGVRLYSRNEMDAARKHFECVLALAREAKQKGAEGEAHRMLGQILNFKAQYPAARAELEQALAIFRDASYHLGMGRVHQALGYTAWGMGDREQARECYYRSLAEFEAAGDLSQLANAAYNLAFLEPGYEEPVKLIRRGLELARQIGNQPLEGDLLHLWADRDFDKGDFATAAEKLEQDRLGVGQKHAPPAFCDLVSTPKPP